jgi:trehalose-phosphatase
MGDSSSAHDSAAARAALGRPISLDPPAALSELLGTRLDGDPLLLLFDVDGTLAPIAPRPEEALVSDAMRESLAALVALPRTHVAIVSGRGAPDARRIVGVPGVWIIGNHGIEISSPEGVVEIEPSVKAHGGALADAAAELRDVARSVKGARLEDKRWSLALHFRLAEPRTEPLLRHSADAIALRHGLRRTDGKQVLELRAPVPVDKGTAALALATRLGASEQGSVLYAGDDQTDEDAFRRLREHTARSVTVRVSDGETPTAAEFVVSGPDSLRPVLEWLRSKAR